MEVWGSYREKGERFEEKNFRIGGEMVKKRGFPLFYARKLTKVKGSDRSELPLIDQRFTQKFSALP